MGSNDFPTNKQKYDGRQRDQAAVTVATDTHCSKGSAFLFTFHSSNSEIFSFFPKIELPSITETFPMCRRSTFCSVTLATLCRMSALLQMQT